MLRYFQYSCRFEDEICLFLNISVNCSDCFSEFGKSFQIYISHDISALENIFLAPVQIVCLDDGNGDNYNVKFY